MPRINIQITIDTENRSFAQKSLIGQHARQYTQTLQPLLKSYIKKRIETDGIFIEEKHVNVEAEVYSD